MKRTYAAPFEKYLNLADARLGTVYPSVTDDWFAAADRMLPAPRAGVEGRRLRRQGNGWTAGSRGASASKATTMRSIRLGVPGSINGRRHRHPLVHGQLPALRLPGSLLLRRGDRRDAAWTEVLPAVEMQGNSPTTMPSR